MGASGRFGRFVPGPSENAQMLCSQAIIVKREKTRASAKVLHCNNWTCEICRPRRVRQLIGTAIRGKAKIFVTLTVNPGLPGTAEDRCKLLIMYWRKIVKDACKRYGYKKIPFLAVVEAQKSGEPHLHIIARVPYIAQHWLSNRMKHYLNSPICWVEEIKSRRKLGNYIAKYIGKDPHKFGTCKRYWRSMSFVARIKKEKPAWYEDQPDFSILENTIEQQARTWKWLGYKLIFRRPWTISIRPGDPEYFTTECEA